MRVDFPKKSNVLVQKQNFKWRRFLRRRTTELQFTVYCAKLRNFKSQIVLCAKVELLNFEAQYIPFAEAKLRNFKSQNIFLCGGGTAGLLFKALVWKRNCETSSRTKLIVWKRNCVTSKPQYIPCTEAEMRNFRASSHTIFCMRKRNCLTLSLSIFLVRRRNCGNSRQRIFHVRKRNCRTSSHIIVCVQKQNFKSHNILCVESLWFLVHEPEVPGGAGPKAPVSKPYWRCCSQQCHLGDGPYWDFFFSLHRSYQAWSN